MKTENGANEANQNKKVAWSKKKTGEETDRMRLFSILLFCHRGIQSWSSTIQKAVWTAFAHTFIQRKKADPVIIPNKYSCCWTRLFRSVNGGGASYVVMLATRKPVYTFTRIIPQKIHTCSCMFPDPVVSSLGIPVAPRTFWWIKHLSADFCLFSCQNETLKSEEKEQGKQTLSERHCDYLPQVREEMLAVNLVETFGPGIFKLFNWLDCVRSDRQGHN